METRGKFIVYSGVTCTGKDLQAKLTVEAFLRADIPAEFTFEPTHGPIGAVVRSYIEKAKGINVFTAFHAADLVFAHKPKLLAKAKNNLEAIGKGEKIPTLDLQFMYMADRRWHLAHIGKKLAEGISQICSRFELSTFAHGTANGEKLEDLLMLQDDTLKGVYVEPDLTEYLRLSPEEAALRLDKSRKVKDIFETVAGIRKTAEAYDKVIDFGRQHGRFGKIVEVDGERPIDRITASLLSEIRMSFGERFKKIR